MTTPLQSIIIADDDAALGKNLPEMLRRLGYTVPGAAADGLQAVELVRVHKPHLLLVDYRMPGLNGLEVVKQVAAFGTTASIILTGDPDPVHAVEAMSMGASGYIQKPFEVAQLRAAMEAAWFQFQIMKTLQGEKGALSEALELRKLTEKAKGILMAQQGFSEDEAHKMLQKMSQSQGLSLKELCRSIIQVKMILGKGAIRRQAA